MSPDELKSLIGALPRVKLASAPTPLEVASNLSNEVGHTVLVKREDLTGLALGGNKVRHLEFRMGEAVARGYDAVVHPCGRDSNHGRLLAAACAKLGLQCYLVIRDYIDGSTRNGNLLLDELLGAHIVPQPRTDDNTFYQAVAERLRLDGHRPYVTIENPLNDYGGTIAYVEVSLELIEQLRGMGIEEASVFMVAGTSMAGLILGSSTVGANLEVIGVASGDRPNIHLEVARCAKRVSCLLGLGSLQPIDINVTYDHIGQGYGVITQECNDAIKLAARTEGLLLDPTYTGKAMAGLLSYLRDGNPVRGGVAVFVHTGGTPEIFNRAPELLE